MSDNLILPEGVTIPDWFRRYLEVTAPVPGVPNVVSPVEAAVPPSPPVADVPLPPQPPQADFAETCKNFKRMGGKNFNGTETFVEAGNWLKETEDLLATFDIGDRRKVLLAVWLLKEEAARWWVVTTATRPIETWDDFRGRFGLRFLSLKQGDMTIREYIDKFNQLARVDLDLVNTAQKKALHFALGLNEPLHGLAMSHIPLGATFESLVNMALLQEEDNNDKKEVKANESQGKRVNSGKRGKNINNRKDKSRENRKCNFCGKVGHVSRECRKKKRKRGECFHCGEFGHLSKDCPRKQGQGQTQYAGLSGGRVHPLNTVLPAHDRGSVSVESLVYIF